MEAQYRAFVSEFGSDYEEDRTSTLAAAMKYQPDMETLTLAVEEAVEWLCSFRGDEPAGIGPEMIDAAIKAAVEAKASGANADGIQRATDDVCSELFDRSLREVRAGTRKLAPDADGLVS